MMEDQIKYWDKTWKGRIKADGIAGNQGKYSKILDFIWRRPQYFSLSKLEVGCGPAQHALQISKLVKEYTRDWRGVDLSPTAVKYVVSKGLRAKCVDFLKWEVPLKFQCFTFWDSLEHFEDINEVAAKVHELAAEEFMVQGNVPLYLSPISEQGGIEKPININMLRAFWDRLGLGNVGYQVYGINGFPYLMFEANNFKEIE